MKQKLDGYNRYWVSFIYEGKHYQCSFESTAQITPNTDKKITWDIVDDVIKDKLKEIPSRKDDVYPHDIVLIGEYGRLTIKE